MSDKENDLIMRRYPDTNMDDLMVLAEGMSSLTYLDMLLSDIKYDLGHEAFSREEQILARQIIEKAEYFKAHNGRNLIRGFEPEKYCKAADKLSEQALGTKIGNEFYRIDQLINYIRSRKNQIKSEKALNKIVVCLGVKLGEIMLEKGLLELGYDWKFIREGTNPCICAPSAVFCDPIAFIYRKMHKDPAVFDTEGTTSDFYYNFMDRSKG